MPRFLDEALSSVHKCLTKHWRLGWWDSWSLCLRRFVEARTVRVGYAIIVHVFWTVHGFISMAQDRRLICLSSKTPMRCMRLCLQKQDSTRSAPCHAKERDKNEDMNLIDQKNTKSPKMNVPQPKHMCCTPHFNHQLACLLVHPPTFLVRRQPRRYELEAAKGGRPVSKTIVLQVHIHDRRLPSRASPSCCRPHESCP